MYPESSDRFKRAAMSDFRKRCDEAAAQMVLVLQSAYSSSEVKHFFESRMHEQKDVAEL